MTCPVCVEFHARKHLLRNYIEKVRIEKRIKELEDFQKHHSFCEDWVLDELKALLTPAKQETEKEKAELKK